jgi:hypothetical protein
LKKEEQKNFEFFFMMQVTGKAVMLDEIINYVQSLQRQVEVSYIIFQWSCVCFTSYFTLHVHHELLNVYFNGRVDQRLVMHNATNISSVLILFSSLGNQFLQELLGTYIMCSLLFPFGNLDGWICRTASWIQVTKILLFLNDLFLLQFLSMKLASVNPQLDYNLDCILNKEVCTNTG